MTCGCTDCACLTKKKNVPVSELKQMAGYYLSLMEGDTHQIDSAYEFMRKHGIVDKDGFEIDDEEE